MTLAEKIAFHRKRRGWSQEELAEKLNVSRQSVSKWEGAASVPELDKIILLAQIFGITTDALLLDTISPEADTSPATPPVSDFKTGPSLRLVSLQEGQDYAALMHHTARRFALAVSACMFAVMQLILLGSISEYRSIITEEMAGGIGVTVLLVIVAAAVAVFISGGMRLSQYRYISEEPFQATPELLRWAGEEKERLTPMFTRHVIAGVTICILGVIPLILMGCLHAEEFHLVLALILLLWMIAVAVHLFVRGGMRYECFTQLLQQEDYTPERKRVEHHISGAYWCMVVALYLALSFLTNRWDRTWIVWPCAGVLYGAICAAASAWSHRG